MEVLNRLLENGQWLLQFEESNVVANGEHNRALAFQFKIEGAPASHAQLLINKSINVIFPLQLDPAMPHARRIMEDAYEQVQYFIKCMSDAMKYANKDVPRYALLDDASLMYHDLVNTKGTLFKGVHLTIAVTHTPADAESPPLVRYEILSAYVKTKRGAVI